jgi:hypothetical protein
MPGSASFNPVGGEQTQIIGDDDQSVAGKVNADTNVSMDGKNPATWKSNQVSLLVKFLIANLVDSKEQRMPMGSEFEWCNGPWTRK